MKLYKCTKWGNSFVKSLFITCHLKDEFELNGRLIKWKRKGKKKRNKKKNTHTKKKKQNLFLIVVFSTLFLIILVILLFFLFIVHKVGSDHPVSRASSSRKEWRRTNFIGSLSKHDVHGSENVIWKCNFAFLQSYFNYSKLLCLKNLS